MTKQPFTVVIPAHVGFTDQLMRLWLMYRIGSSCGLRFVCTPFTSDRSPAEFWQHFRMDLAFDMITADDQARPGARIDLSRQRLRYDRVTHGAALRRCVAEQIRDDQALVVFELADSRPQLVKLLSDAPEMFSSDFEERLRRIFRPARPERNKTILHAVAHVRCGDIADLPVSTDRTYLTFGERMVAAPLAITNPFLTAEIARRQIARACGPGKLDFHLFSDGYRRTHDSLAQARASDECPLQPSEAELVEDALAVNEAMALGLLEAAGIPGDVGESMESLVDLVERACRADLIMITGRQRFIPKLLTLLGEISSPPGLLLLESDQDFVRYIRGSGLGERHATLISLAGNGNPFTPLRTYLDYRTRLHEVPVQQLARQAGIGSFCIPELWTQAQALSRQGDTGNALTLFDWLLVLTSEAPEIHQARAACADAHQEPSADRDMARHYAEALTQAQIDLHWKFSAATAMHRFGMARKLLENTRSLLGGTDTFRELERGLDWRDETHARPEPEAGLKRSRSGLKPWLRMPFGRRAKRK